MTVPFPIVRPGRRARKPETPSPGWRERAQAVRHVPRLLRMVWRSEPRYVAGILVLRVLRSVVPLVVLWIGKLIVDEVVQAVGAAGRGGAVDWHRLAELVLFELVVAMIGEGLARISSLLESLLGDLFANETSVELMRHAASLDLEQFEDADAGRGARALRALAPGAAHRRGRPLAPR
jgi:ATP-binding cassette, subfamily B, bacterial